MAIKLEVYSDDTKTITQEGGGEPGVMKAPISNPENALRINVPFAKLVCPKGARNQEQASSFDA